MKRVPHVDVFTLSFDGVADFGHAWAGEFKAFIAPGVDLPQIISVLKEFIEAMEHGAAIPPITGVHRGD